MGTVTSPCELGRMSNICVYLRLSLTWFTWCSICMSDDTLWAQSCESKITALLFTRNKKCNVISKFAVFLYIFFPPTHFLIYLSVRPYSCRSLMCSQDSGVPKTLQSFIPRAPSLFVLVLFYCAKHEWNKNGKVGEKVITWQWLDLQLDLIFSESGERFWIPVLFDVCPLRDAYRWCFWE